MPSQRDLVTLAELKRVTGITHNEHDFLLQVYLDQATDTILNYVARSDDDWTAEMDAWTHDTVPGDLQNCILQQAAEYFRFRGDQVAGEMPARQHGFLSPVIVSILHRYRDPVIG